MYSCSSLHSLTHFELLLVATAVPCNSPQYGVVDGLLGVQRGHRKVPHNLRVVLRVGGAEPLGPVALEHAGVRRDALVLEAGQTARKGTVLNNIAVEAHQKDSALQLTWRQDRANCMVSSRKEIWPSGGSIHCVVGPGPGKTATQQSVSWQAQEMVT
eukprot:SAG22_NODE_7354_length_748_cov_1.234206_1_plen_156_part_01